MLYYALIALAVLAAVLVLFLIVVAMQPSQFRIERKGKITAPPAIVFGHVNDLHKWTSWSPWEKLDPGMQREYSGEPQGKGAAYAWVGNDDVGKGSMRIIESQPPSTVAIELEFEEPWQATNATLFSVNPDGDGSRVTWGMDGESNFVFKAVGLFMNMDEMVGKDFEAGLDNLARVAEIEAKKGAAATPSP